MGSPSVPAAPSTGNAQNLFNTGLNSQFNVANQAQGYTGNILNNALCAGVPVGCEPSRGLPGKYACAIPANIIAESFRRRIGGTALRAVDFADRF